MMDLEELLEIPDDILDYRFNIKLYNLNPVIRPIINHYLLLGILFLLLAIFLILIPFLKMLSDVWISFSGAVLGGLLCGIMTVYGVIIAFRLNKREEEKRIFIEFEKTFGLYTACLQAIGHQLNLILDGIQAKNLSPYLKDLNELSNHPTIVDFYDRLGMLQTVDYNFAMIIKNYFDTFLKYSESIEETKTALLDNHEYNKPEFVVAIKELMGAEKTFLIALYLYNQ